MSQASVRLTRFASSAPANPDGLLASKLIVEASGRNMPSEIFVMHRSLAGTEESFAVFEAVATPTSLEAYPLAPAVSGDEDGPAQPYYRTSRIELLFEHPSDMEQTYRDIETDVNYLVESMNALERLSLSGSAVLNGVTVAEDPEGAAQSNITETPLEWRPAGTPALSGSDQIILDPDSSLKGWLPVSAYDGEVPEGAVFFYNLEQDTAASAAASLETDDPFPVFSLNGHILPDNVVLLSGGQIWWLYFAPETIYYPLDGNAPWPLNYGGEPYSGIPPKLLISNPT